MQSMRNEKIALVTGGSRGLGRNTVLSLAKRGVNSIFTYNSNRAEAENVAAAAAEAGIKSVSLQLNQTTRHWDTQAASCEISAGAVCVARSVSTAFVTSGV